MVIGGIIFSVLTKKVKPGTIKSILFVGDSNTAANFSYADQLKKQYPGLKIKKIAQNGANTAWMKQQLTAELNNNRYDAVCILGGSNDVYGGVKLATTQANLTYMYNLAHTKNAKVIAISPPNKNFYTNKTVDKQKTLLELEYWLAHNPKTDYFIDFYTLTNNKALFTATDNFLHPQTPAHKILAQKTSNILNLA